MSIIDKVKSEIDQSNEKDKAQVLERFDILEKLCQAKENELVARIEKALAPLIEKKVLISTQEGGSFIKRSHIGASTGVDGAISGAVDSFFGDATKDKDGKPSPDIAGGFKKLIQAGLGALLGDTKASGDSTEMFFYSAENNVIKRTDLQLWRYDLKAGAVRTQADTAFVYVFSKTLCDYKYINDTVIVENISKYVGGNLDNVKAYLDKIYAVLEYIGKHRPPLNAAAIEHVAHMRALGAVPGTP